MKFISATIAALALLVVAPVAEAKPKKVAAEVVEAKDTFTCELVEMKMIGVPDGRFDIAYSPLVRMKCKNTGKKTVRIDVAHVFIEDEEYEYPISDDIENFNNFYGTADGIQFARHHIDIAPGKTADFVMYFEDCMSQWGVGLTLDLNGTKYPLPVLPH